MKLKAIKTIPELNAWYAIILRKIFAPVLALSLVGIVYYTVKDDKEGVLAGIIFASAVLASITIGYISTRIKIRK